MGNVRGEGLLLGMEFVQDRETLAPFDTAVNVGGRIHQEALKRGLVLRASPGFLALAPPLITTEDEADAMFEILVESVEAVGATLGV